MTTESEIDLSTVLANETMTTEEACRALKCRRAWLYSPAGKAAIGAGFKLGRSRRYRTEVIRAALSGQATAN